MLKPLCIVVLLLSIFSIVWLRSSFVSLEYSISSLEKKKSVLMKDRKMLAAERASLLSVERFEKVAGNSNVNGRFTFPDRVKVVYVKKAKDNEPYRASFKER
jgi:cell division protein FtsL